MNNLGFLAAYTGMLDVAARRGENNSHSQTGRRRKRSIAARLLGLA